LASENGIRRASLRGSSRLLLGGGLLLALAALALPPAHADAFQCDFAYTSGQPIFAGGGPSVWETTDDAQFADAVLLAGSLGRQDAFDSTFLAHINKSPYAHSGDDCTREASGRELAYPAVENVIPGIALAPKLYVDRRKPFARALATIENIGASPITFAFTWQGSFGSDSATAVDRTSSGNGVMANNDRWATSCEDVEVDGCVKQDDIVRDPELAHNWEGRGASVSADTVGDLEVGAGNNQLTFGGVELGPDQKITFIQVVSLGKNIKQVRRASAAIDAHPGRYGIFAGMSKAERRRLANW
jgi:hypothetical protein